MNRDMLGADATPWTSNPEPYYINLATAAGRGPGERNKCQPVLRDGSYRLFFYAGDREEPPHIHVEREDKIAKIWLEPVRFQRNGGFRRAEIGRIQKVASEHRAELLEAWHDYFDR